MALSFGCRSGAAAGWPCDGRRGAGAVGRLRALPDMDVRVDFDRRGQGPGPGPGPVLSSCLAGNPGLMPRTRVTRHRRARMQGNRPGLVAAMLQAPGAARGLIALRLRWCGKGTLLAAPFRRWLAVTAVGVHPARRLGGRGGAAAALTSIGGGQAGGRAGRRSARSCKPWPSAGGPAAGTAGAVRRAAVHLAGPACPRWHWCGHAHPSPRHGAVPWVA